MDLLFNITVYSLVLNDVLTDMKRTKHAFSKSLKQASADVFIWHWNTLGFQQPGNGFHQFSSLAFLIASAPNKDIKYCSYVW